MIDALGHWFRNKLSGMRYAFYFFLFLLKESIHFPWTKRIGFKVLIMQIYFTGVEALSVVALISLGIGAVIIIQGVAVLPMFGQGELMYTILIMVITRELGPMLTAFIITARSGSAITTELGNMVISHEMEAYQSIGIHPLSYLGVPRLYGVVLAMLFLNIYFNLFGLLGSYLVASFIHDIPFSDYIYNLIQALTGEDILSAFLKSIVFGIIIAVVSIYYGFNVNRAVTEVPQKTIKSIGLSITLCIIADAILVVVTRLLGDHKMHWNQVPIVLKDVSFTDQQISILKDLNLEFKPSSVTILLGGSGCGKSSVLKAAAGLIPITGGTVKYGENSIYGLNQKEYARMQQHTGFMFQDGALWANKSIQDNLSLPLEIADPKAKPEAVQRKIEEALDIFSMCGSLNSRPSGLSSGERKIVSFLRAIITEPDILFLDEPTTFIDRASVLKLIKNLFRFKEEGKTILMVTHDMNLARSLGDYFVFLHEGQPILFDTVSACMASDEPLWTKFLADRIGHESPSLDKPVERVHSNIQEEGT